MKSKDIRVLIVDDSAVVRGLLSRALETDPLITVAGTAMHGELALAWMRKDSAQVVILDVEMPIMDGLTTLRKLQEEFPSVHVIMASGLTQAGAKTTIQALALGAADCIAKPVSSSPSESIAQVAAELVPLVKALGTPQSPKPPGRAAVTNSYQKRAQRADFTPNLLVIGSSTGGPKALTEVLSGLPGDFPLPTLIVQHMPPLFTPMLAVHLAKDSGRPCQEAVDGEPIKRGHTYIAPGDYHVVIKKEGDLMVTTLNQNDPEHYCRPSVNPLFRSAAEWYGPSTLAVMLTGMGSDGIEGTHEIVERGGYVIAQDEASSVVWGMPAAVANAKLANEVLPLKSIAHSIGRLCSREVCRT